MNVNTDFAQYKSYAEAEERAQLMSKEVISDVKTDLANQGLEEPQSGD